MIMNNTNNCQKVALITGGSAGIGLAIARAFFSMGYRVIVVSRKQSALSDELGSNVLCLQADISKIPEIHRVIAESIEWAGRIDVLINNVGLSAWRPLDKIDEVFWAEMIDTNLKSVLFMTKEALRYLGSGSSVINISSLAGKRGSANNSTYCAAKFGVNGLTQSFAKELGSRGIRVNAVCPVYIQTPGLSEALVDIESPVQGGDIGVYMQSFAKSQSALGVLPTAKEVADTCLFLASDAASAITGQCINVDCGVMPQ